MMESPKLKMIHFGLGDHTPKKKQKRRMPGNSDKLTLKEVANPIQHFVHDIELLSLQIKSYRQTFYRLESYQHHPVYIWSSLIGHQRTEAARQRRIKMKHWLRHPIGWWEVIRVGKVKFTLSSAHSQFNIVHCWHLPFTTVTWNVDNGRLWRTVSLSFTTTLCRIMSTVSLFLVSRPKKKRLTDYRIHAH